MKKFILITLMLLMAVFTNTLFSTAAEILVTGRSLGFHYERPNLFPNETVIPGDIVATLKTKDGKVYVGNTSICSRSGSYQILISDMTPNFYLFEHLGSYIGKLTLNHSSSLFSDTRYDYWAGQTIYGQFNYWGIFVSEIDDLETLKSSALAQNYPNPFNPDTLIRFTLAKDADVSVNIYNIKGQLVKTLVNDHRKAGEHQVSWNGIDDNGTPVGSGVYLYRMQTNEYLSTKRMILLK